MQRRNLLCQLPAWLAAPGFARAQSGPRLLVVLTTFAKANVPAVEPLALQELARLGWRVGDNLRVEFRYADNQPERLDALAREPVALQPTAALATEDSSVRALLRHTKQLPIVVAFTPDPVANGLAASLGRPGGQVTGVTNLFVDIRPRTTNWRDRWRRRRGAWPGFSMAG